MNIKKIFNAMFGDRIETVTINGASYSGRSVSITAEGVWVDNELLPDTTQVGPITIAIHGNVDVLESMTGDVNVEGHVNNIRTSLGNVSIAGPVGGSVTTTLGNVDAYDVRGSITTTLGDVSVRGVAR